MPLSARLIAALIATPAFLGLTACGGNDTWEGSVPQDTDAQIGDWEGRLGEVAVECSGDPEGDVTMTVKTPDGRFVATLPRPDGGDPSKVIVKGPDRDVTWDETGTSTIPEAEPDLDDLPVWGTDLTVSADDEGELDEYGGGGSWRFSMPGGVLSCEKQE